MNAKEIAQWSDGIFGWIDGQVGGWRTYTHDECYHLAEAALDSVPEGGQMLEIGTYTGLSSSVLLQVARARKARLALIDMFMWTQGFKGGAEVEAHLRSVLCQFPDVHWRMYYCSSATAHGVATQEEFIGGSVVRPFVDGAALDFLHIDGNHEDVKADCALWFPHLKPQCTVAFHDANPNPAAPVGCMVVKDALKWTPESEGWREVWWSKDMNCLMVRRRS